MSMPDTRRTRVVLATLLAAAVALIAVSYLGGSAPLRAIGGTVFGAAERAIGSVAGPVTAAFGAGGGSASARVRRLERQLVSLRAQLSNQQVSRTEYGQLSRLLRLPRRDGYRVIAANVIAVSQGPERAVTLDVGSSDGVRPEETVLNDAGLVGTVTAVSPWTCTVVLATAGSAVAGVRVANTGQMGWVSGTGDSRPGTGLLRLQILGSGTALAPGQRLVTSASVGDKPYVPGIPVGVVTRVQPNSGATSETALVRPFADFNALNVVGVIVTPSRPGGAAGRLGLGAGG
jgi:rod shape-determining protein MreC